MGGVIDATKSVYNMVEDNRKMQKDYQHQNSQIAHQQQQNRRNKTNILEQQLAERRARIGAMGISHSGSAAAGQYRTAYEAQKDMAEDDYNYYDQAQQLRNDTRFKLRKNTVNGLMDATNSLTSLIR